MTFKYLLIVILLACLSVLSFGQEKDAKKLEKEKNITLCKIEKNPDQFLGKPLDIEALYVSGLEMGWLEDSGHCENQGGKRFSILYKFDENYERASDVKALQQANKVLKRKLKDSTDVHKVQGQFRVLISKYIKKNDYDTRYEYEITVLKIILVVSNTR